MFQLTPVLLAVAFSVPPGTDGNPTPPPSPAHESVLADRVAQDAYLGGQGVAGPAALLGSMFIVVAEPILGVAGSLLTYGGQLSTAEAHLGRSVVASGVKTLSFAGLFGGLWALLLPVLVTIQVGMPVLAGAAAWGLGGALGARVPRVMGLTLLAGGLAGVGVVLSVGLPWWLARRAGVWLGDLAWDGMPTGEPQNPTTGDADSPLGAALDSGSLRGVRSGVLSTAAAGGAWERSMAWDGFPVVGPWLTAATSHARVVQRLTDVRQVTGQAPPPRTLPLEVAAVMGLRSLVLSVGQGLMVTGAGLAALSGGVVLAATLVSAPVLGVGLGLAGLVGAVGVGGLGLGLGAVGVLLTSVTPWTVAYLANREG